MSVPEIDRLLGIEVYGTKMLGLGGLIRESVEDFVVEEILVDGSKASISSEVPSKVLSSSAQKQRFLLCVLVKRNWDTFLAVKNVAKALCIDQERVQFAGIKDAKAVTAQYVTLENVSREDAAKVEVKDITIKPVGYVREPMSLFYLLGNAFTITIKNIYHTKEIIQERVNQTVKELEEIGGIPNFFGHQRFGTTRPITHKVGKALSHANFEEAAMFFLAKPSKYEHLNSRQARQELESTLDFKKAFENFPKQLRFERLMLRHLAERPDDFLGAFKRLPLKLQALFVQAYQSYLFNRFLSERIKGGLPLSEALVGDFVVGVERSGLPLTIVPKIVTAESLIDCNKKVKEGKLRVALPIFGAKQKLSQGVMGQIERSVLAVEGLEEEPLRLNELSKVGGKGGLRCVLSPVRDFKLNNVSDNFAQACFMLNRGSYATIVLRELMKPSDLIKSGF